MSIIAVVSLIQGLNASVKQAILNEAGADSFVVQQFGIVRSDEDLEDLDDVAIEATGNITVSALDESHILSMLGAVSIAAGGSGTASINVSIAATYAD